MAIKIDINPSYKWAEVVKGKGITARELEVIVLLAQGFNNEDIADILKIKYQSVKNHMFNLTKKLGANNSAQALLMVIGNNMVKVENPEFIGKPEGKPSKKDKFWRVVDILAGDDSDLGKQVKKWMIRNGIDVDI